MYELYCGELRDRMITNTHRVAAARKRALAALSARQAAEQRRAQRAKLTGLRTRIAQLEKQARPPIQKVVERKRVILPPLFGAGR